MLFQFLFAITQTIILSSCLNIDDFGAIADDSSFSTSLSNWDAYRAALYTANNGSDRVVVISAGKSYNMIPRGTISGLVNVTVQLDGSINSYIVDPKQWPVDSTGNGINLMDIANCRGLVIRGTGSINGYGYVWWWEVWLTGYDNRPNLLNIYNCNHTLIDGITLSNSPMFHAYLMNHLNLTVQNVRVYVNLTGENITVPTFPLNTDGIDVSGRDIYLRNLTIENYDDAVAVKPLSSSPGNYANCTENVLIEDCYVKYGVGMSIGSVPPDPNVNCIRNVTIRNIKFDKPFKAIYIKPNPGDIGYGLISNILYENIEINDATWWAVFIATQQEHQPFQNGTDCSFFFPLLNTTCIPNPRITVENITLRNVNIYKGVFSPGIMLCDPSNPCKNFLFDSVNVYNRSFFPFEDGFLCQNVTGDAINSNLAPKCLNFH